MKRWVYGLLATVCLALALVPAVRAAVVNYSTGIIGGSIQFDTSNGTVTGCEKNVTSANIPDTIENVNVTSIGNGAFWYCESLTSVSIPNGVTSIGQDAFFYCSSLTSVSIPNSVTSISDGAFSRCSGLTSVGIPNGVTSIGDFAFANCSSLTSVTIPNSVTFIGRSVFSRCNSLTGITVAADHPIYSSIYGVLFDKAVTKLYAYPGGKTGAYSIPNSVTSIGDFAFAGCSGLTGVTIPNSITSIGERAFEGCNSLTNMSVPNSVTSISNYMFAGCSGLTSVDIPKSVTSIGEWAFEGCNSLTNMSIPNSVTSIGNYAFYNCSGLTRVSIPNSVTAIGSSAFYYSNLTDVYYDGTEDEYTTKLLPNIDNSYNRNDIFLNARFDFKVSPAPNPSPGTLPNTAAQDNVTLYGALFLILSALTLMVWALGRRKKDR